LNQDYIRKQMSVVKLQEFLRPLFFFFFTLTELAILWFGGTQTIRGQMTLGELLQFNVMIASLTFPILSLGWMMSLSQQGISAMNRINYILDYPVEDHSNKKTLQNQDLTIEVKNLTYYYPGESEPVLKNINLTVTPGQTLGITGPVGCGKTTLLNILTGLLKPPAGHVFVNGNDICDLDIEDFYKSVGVVSQDPFLFSRTLAENIGLARESLSREAIRQAADNAGLAKDIQGFHDGYDQPIGERGITLSGGQKQRTAIARALARCSPLQVMDDPLSNVDSRTEEQILHHLKANRCYHTMVLVSHRISVLKITDIIYVMENGTIAEQGSHGELMQLDGLYSRLARTQQMKIELEEGL